MAKAKKKNRKSKSDTVNKLLIATAILNLIRAALELIKKLIE